MKTTSIRSRQTGSATIFSRRAFFCISAICLGFIVSAAPAQAQEWATVIDAEGDTGELVYKITSDSAGNIFAAGSMRDATERPHAVIMKSSDSGATWSTVVDYPAVSDVGAPNGVGARFDTITSADVGGERHLVASGMIGRARNSQWFTSPQWITIRSRDDGATWETLDEYIHPTYSSVLTPRDVAMDASGNIYVVGMAKEGQASTSPSHWLIRKGLATAGGMVWSTVGDFSYADGWDYAYDHAWDADGASGVVCVGTSVFVVGGGADSWIVRKSSNGGSTWQVVDTYQYGKRLKSHAFDVAADSAGNVYVAGYGQKLGTRWVVRRGTNGGTKWSTVDDFRLPSGSYAEGRGISIDASNNVHVSGMATTSNSPKSYGNWNWVTRQRSAATGAWSTTDTFSLAADQDTAARSVTVDPAGNVFAAGYGFDADGIRHGWIVRREPAP